VFDILRRNRQLGGVGRALIHRQVQRFDPDLLLMTRHAVRLGATRLEHLVPQFRSALWFFDTTPQPGVMDLAQLVDESYLTTAAQLPVWQASGLTNVRFLPQGVDPDLDRPGTVREHYRCDVSFVGSGPYPYRWPVLQRVAAAGHRFQIRGPGWEGAPADLPIAGGEVRGADFADVITSAAVSLGAHATPEQAAEHASASNRMWKVLGCGGAYLGPWLPGIDHFARDGEHCAWYRDPDDAVARLDQLLRAPTERRAMAARGRHHALAEHSYDRRLALLLAGTGYPVPPPTNV